MNSVRLCVLVALLGYSLAKKMIEMEGQFKHKSASQSPRHKLSQTLKKRMSLAAGKHI